MMLEKAKGGDGTGESTRLLGTVILGWGLYSSARPSSTETNARRGLRLQRKLSRDNRVSC